MRVLKLRDARVGDEWAVSDFVINGVQSLLFITVQA
jgi:hypothetical protein